MKAFVFLVIFFFLNACSFLDADLNKSKITTNSVFSNDVTATAAMTAIYYNMNLSSRGLNGAPTSMNAITGLSAGDLYNYGQGQDFIAFEQHNIQSLNPNIEQLWNGMYSVIYQANAVLEGVQNSSSLSEAIRRQLRGEALFIRAFTYFYLVNLFGDIPLAVETDYHNNRLLSRRPVDDVYALIEKDLLEAQTLLSKDYITVQRVVPNQATVTALLARVYLYKQQYEKASSLATDVINDATYQLTPQPDIVKTFLINSRETIWQVLPVVPNYNTTEAQYFIIVSAPPPNHVITNTLSAHFEPGDLRAKNWINNITSPTFGTFYYPFKYKQNLKDTKAEFAEASIVFRLAEMYLIRAESRTQLGRLVGANSASSDLNLIRERAGLPNTTATDKQSLLRAIESERWSELFTEYGHRWLDLKRTGRAIEVLGNGITTDDLLYPLPAAEFAKDPNLGEQNSGY